MFMTGCITINSSCGVRLSSTYRMQNTSCSLLDMSVVSFAIIVYVTEFYIFCVISRRT